MGKKSLIIVLSLVAVIITILVSWGLTQQKTDLQLPNDGSLRYYYGEQCSHCKNVTEFISANKLDEKLSIIKKEVFEPANKKNANEWVAYAKSCGLQESELGVPFLYAKGNCYMGDVDVIDFLKKEAVIE